jgi:hypothetical protein
MEKSTDTAEIALNVEILSALNWAGADDLEKLDAIKRAVDRHVLLLDADQLIEVGSRVDENRSKLPAYSEIVRQQRRTLWGHRA